MRRNGLIKQVKKLKKGLVAPMQEKIDQDFSGAGGRLTSVEPLAKLNLRDKIVTSFSVHDAKTSKIRQKTRSLLASFKESPVKERFLITNVDEPPEKKKKYSVNTKKIKSLVKNGLEIKYEPSLLKNSTNITLHATKSS